MENSTEVPQKWKLGPSPKKKKTEPRHNWATPLLGTDAKETKTLTQKDICTPMFIAALFTIAKIWKQFLCPSIDATHSSILAWKISRTEGPGGLQSLGFQRVGHDWATNTNYWWMEEENVGCIYTYTQWNTKSHKKIMKLCHLWQHGWFSRTLYWVRWVRER